VKICGDLGRINATGNGALVPAVKSLSVFSLGEAGHLSQNPANFSDLSFVQGTIGALKVTTNVSDVQILAGKINTVNVGGNVQDSKFYVVGNGAAKNATEALAIKSFNVRGDFDHSSLLGGAFVLANADVQIGKITIGGDFRASNLTAGVTGGADGLLGTADDHLYAGGSDAVVSRIASVVIKGQAIGTNEAGGRFAIEAEQIGSVKVGATKVLLNKTAKDKYVALGGTGDLFVNEV